MDFKNYEKLIKCLIQSCERRKNEKRIRSDKNFFIFSFLLLIIAIWLASALLLLDKSPPPNGHPQRIITPSPDGCNCNNLALNVWPFISDKYKRRLPSKLISKWFFVLLLLCAGDVHPNPGPGQSERIQLLIKKQLHVKLGPVFGFKEVGPVLEFGEVGPVFGFREAYLTVKKMPKVCPARRCGMQVGDIIEAGTAENLKNSHLIEDEILRKGCIGIGHMKITVLRPIPLTYEEPISAQNAIYETPVREQHQEQLTSVPPYKGKKLFQDADFPTRSIGRKRKCTNEIDTDRKSMKKVKRQIEKSTNLLSPDIICSGHSQKVVSFYFNPVDLSWQLTRAALLGLQNFRPQNINTCYTNAVVQALLGLDGFRKSIMSVIEGNIENVTENEAKLCRAFADLIIAENTGNAPAQSTFHLRELIDGPDWPKYQLDDQQDSAEFFMDLLRKMPANVQALFLLKKTSIRTCRICSKVVDSSVQGEPEWEYITSRLPGVQKMQFVDLLRPNQLDSQLPCPHCNKRTYQDLRTDLQPWDRNSRYLLMRINHWYGNVEHERIEAESVINGFLSTGTTIFGQRFQASAAITHNGTEREGHNCCWRKIGQEWLLISDNDQIKKRLNRFVGGLRSKAVAEFGYDFVYILIMERERL